MHLGKFHQVEEDGQIEDLPLRDIDRAFPLQHRKSGALIDRIGKIKLGGGQAFEV